MTSSAHRPGPRRRGPPGSSAGRSPRLLAREGWTTFGLSRSGASHDPDGVTAIRADLLDPAALAAALAERAPREFVAITAWTRQDTEAENIAVNGGAVRNLLAALEPAGSVEHVALMTGLKHYLGPFEAYAVGEMADTPFHEDEPRLRLRRTSTTRRRTSCSPPPSAHGFSWSVHRSHTVFGFAIGNAMNMVLDALVYATICKEHGLPFVFPGSETQWNALTDVTDADLLAEQIVWAARTPAGRNEAFNTANGDVFRWRWLWPQLAGYFGLPWEGFAGEPRTLVVAMAGMERHLARDRRTPWPGRARPRPARVLVAQRRRPRPRRSRCSPT